MLLRQSAMRLKCVRLAQSTVLMSLLQPPPETFALFDDVMLLAEGAHCRA